MSGGQELAWALRRLCRRPVSAFGVVVTLTLGIAISVGMFSVLYGVALRGLPYPDADRIVVIHGENLEQGVPRAGLRPVEAIEALADVQGFEHTAYFTGGGLTWTGDGRPLSIRGADVSAGYFSVFSTPAMLGRTLIEADHTERRSVVVLNHEAWRALTGGDPNAVGRTLAFEEGSFEVVGVLPESFAHPVEGLVVYRPVYSWDATAPAYVSSRYFEAVGKLRPDATPALARDGLNARLAAVNAAHGLSGEGWRLSYVPLIEDMVGNVHTGLAALFAVTVLVLLIACANGASLVSIRLEQRRADLAVRRALGAGRRRLVMDVGCEQLVLGVVSATLGVLLAYLMIETLKPFAAGNLPRVDSIRVDLPVLLFAAAVSIASVLLSTAGPMLRALREDPSVSLGKSGRRELEGGRRIAWLPAAGVGLSTVALVTALALATSLIRLGSVDPGFRTDGIAGLGVFRQAPLADMSQLVDTLAAELRAVPGVRGVAAVSGAPLTDIGIFFGEVPEQHVLSEPVRVGVRRATAGYHSLLGIPLVGGRDIEESDRPGSRNAVVVNETLARRVFGNDDPIGRQLTLAMSGQSVQYEIVGVAGDTRQTTLRAPAGPEIVIPYHQQPWVNVTLLVDSAIWPEGWLRTLEQAVWRAAPNQPIYLSFSLGQARDRQTQDARFFATATGWFAVMALLLGAAGINAVVAAMQRRRTREIGLRLALGAAPRQAAGLIVRNAARIVAAGLTMGALLAVPAFVWLREQLFGIGAAGFGTLFGATCVVLIAAGLAAAGWPAWRAARIAPMEALRHE